MSLENKISRSLITVGARYLPVSTLRSLRQALLFKSVLVLKKVFIAYLRK
jgi:hypothetical protein